MHGNITTPLLGRGGRGQRRREKVHGVRERGGGASEGAKLAREHVTTIDGEIQTWLPDTNLVTSKYEKAATCACIPAFIGSPVTVQRVNRGFNPIQQQPSHHHRQQRATQPWNLTFSCVKFLF